MALNVLRIVALNFPFLKNPGELQPLRVKGYFKKNWLCINVSRVLDLPCLSLIDKLNVVGDAKAWSGSRPIKHTYGKNKTKTGSNNNERRPFPTMSMCGCAFVSEATGRGEQGIHTQVLGQSSGLKIGCRLSVWFPYLALHSESQTR